MEFKELSLHGCFEIQPAVLKDDRGYFIKSFQRNMFSARGLAVNFAEEYRTLSHHGVLRGLHFQLPPHDHAKLVFCVSGEALDVIVDLRVNSKTYGHHELLTLSAERANQIYLPPGIAHGFYVTGDHALLSYSVTSVYSPEHDTGILWNSIGIPWPTFDPMISDRDNGFVPFSAFVSPFNV